MQLDKKNKQRFDETEKNEAKYFAKAQKEYSKAYSEMRKVIISFIAKYGIDGKLTQDAYKYDRANKLAKEIVANLSFIDVTSSRNMESYLRDQFEENYLQTGYILESNYQSKLGFKPLKRSAIDTMDTMSKVALNSNAEVVRANLRRALAQSIAQGEGVGNTSRNLKRVMENNLNETLRIARTETTRAMNKANLEGMIKAREKLDIKKVWRATLDERTRRGHQRADGQIVDIDKPFIVNGEKLMYPGDINGSPGNVINCRCVSKEIVAGYENSATYRRARGLDGRNEVIPYKTYTEWARNRL